MGDISEEVAAVADGFERFAWGEIDAYLERLLAVGVNQLVLRMVGQLEPIITRTHLAGLAGVTPNAVIAWEQRGFIRNPLRNADGRVHYRQSDLLAEICIRMTLPPMLIYSRPDPLRAVCVMAKCFDAIESSRRRNYPSLGPFIADGLRTLANHSHANSARIKGWLTKKQQNMTESELLESMFGPLAQRDH